MEQEDPRPGPSGRSRSNQRNQHGFDWRAGLRGDSTRNQGPNTQQNRPFFQNANDRGPRQNIGEQNGGYNRNAGGRGRGRGNPHMRQHYGNNPTRPLGFKTLEELALSDIKDIIIKINEKRTPFFLVLQEQIKWPDEFVLIVQLISKVCQSPFVELRSKLILDICNTSFMNNLLCYLMELPYPERKSANKFYWDNQIEFWKNFITMCGCIVATSPSIALRKCRSLIENVPKACIEGLSQRHGFTLPEEFAIKFGEMKDVLASFEIGNQPLEKRSKLDDDEQPPENFRMLSVVPTRDDLMQTRPFLRPNIVDGAYKDVEHYLDVQFRLLREDCFGPFRDGINQYIMDPQRKKYDHIRVFHNVRFIEPYISQTKIGSLVQIDMRTNRNFRRINWAHNKRFLFGSLVLFTKDNCISFMAATILDRDVNCLSEGKLAVSIIDKEFDDTIYNGDVFTMIESEVYFEPYLHALKVLQDPDLPADMPMQKYIVKVDSIPKPPAYITDNKEFVIKDTNKTIEAEKEDKKGISDELDKMLGLDIDDIGEESELNLEQEKSVNDLMEDMAIENAPTLKFNVLRKDTWPSKEELKLNESQYEAYMLALTHEFAVIQGPPGTGKTYLGINVAKTLLRNIEPKNNCLMLVVCYTNHALDQFLEAIIKITTSVIRIGGQSRNKAMDKINLTNLRRNLSIQHPAHRLFNSEKYGLRDIITRFRKALIFLDVLNNGVISYQSIEYNVREIQALGQYYSRGDGLQGRDPLKYWLFENSAAYVSDFKEILAEYESPVKNKDEDDKDDFLEKLRTEMILDDNDLFDVNEDFEEIRKEMAASFSLEDAKTKLKALVLKYNSTQKYDERYIYRQEIQDLHSKINLYNHMSTLRDHDVRIHISVRTNFARITHEDRWRLYFKWMKYKFQEVKENLAALQREVSAQVNAYEEARMMMDVQLLSDTRVVGMTTSGAARMRKLLQTIAPSIVIVEEAAEVLEQHIVTSLTKSCEHLILIGDHQQLRPSASHMKLAKRYNLEVSLFERMITNGIHSRRLNVQHRMRPEIAQLISPHIYNDLENHPSVEGFENVRGMTSNVFFFTHKHREEPISENMSRSNHKEADMVLGLANYIRQQGYTADDVTILAAYSGQMFYMKKERDNYAYLSGVKVTVVDNYQGEESKIILLSLVRNNDENAIGFLGTENRICVALSRAREGFYMFGNIDMLKQKSTLWQKIAGTLEASGSLGDSFKLTCQNHPQQITTIKNHDDYLQVPEGGCLLKCNFQYNCGHNCLLFCHGYDREHITTKCTMMCERILCDLGHVCPLKCCIQCEPCKVLVPKTLPCGHEMNVYCHREPDDPANKCFTVIDVTLPACGHAAKKCCHIDINKMKCTEQCVHRLDTCGHVCLRRCHVTDDPEHLKYLCGKACARAKKGCQAELIGERGDHQCMKKCHEDCDDCNVQVPKKRTTCKHVDRVACCVNIDTIPCKKNCARTMPCGHYCKKKCSEPCTDCKQMVTKPIPDCEHVIKIECSKEPIRELCKEKCARMLSCGHPCTSVCGQPCDVTKCVKLTTQEFDSPCGHKVKLPCNKSFAFAKGEMKPEMLVQFCRAPCGEELACKHLCRGSCAACYQGRLHAPCRQTCHQDNICGHQCEEPCNQQCPPCKKMCEVKCPHSHCKKLCGAPCVPCTEKCSRRCEHGACSRRCGEPCDRAPCDARCPRRLACGHACRGLCGEPCPPICRDCRPDQFPRDFLGDEYGDDEKFILLQDCGHILELDDMESLMRGDQESIQIRKCPFCRTPIINTNRYKDQVNDLFKKDINPIKERVYGTKAELRKKSMDLSNKYQKYHEKYNSTLNECKELKATFLKFISVLKLHTKVSLLQKEMMIVFLDIFEMITECCSKYTNLKTTELKDEFDQQLGMICKTLVVSDKAVQFFKISQQQQKDIGNEIKRMNAIVQLAKMIMMCRGSDVSEDIKKAKQAVFTLSSFDEDKTVQALKTLQTVIKASGIVSKLERDLIVKAIGMKAGHWYKCPNGHFYVIGECGGAMQVGKCPDCGVPVGGTSHNLLSTNAHAPEMDGSKFPAWSEEANNMANFDL